MGLLQLRYVSKDTLERCPLPGPSAVLLMADSREQLADLNGNPAVIMTEKRVFSDSDLDHGLVRRPRAADAEAILGFYRLAEERGPAVGLRYFVAQCEAGVGRSQAVVAALLRLRGEDEAADSVLAGGTYNRLLYRLILEAGGLQPEPEPLVSVVARVKYPVSRLEALYLSLQRQRYENWELVVVEEGNWSPVLPGRSLIDKRFNRVCAGEPRGHWGHPYRQLGIDAARGEWIGLTNDDNYYVPGYLEQMLFAARKADADLVMCECLHSYSGWAVVPPGGDLGCWLAKAELVRSVPWEGTHLRADADYLKRLLARSRRVATVDRPLFVHN